MAFTIVSSPETLRSVFRQALASATGVDVAVAWATPCEPLARLCDFARAGGKLRVVVGQDFAGTDPRAVRRLFNAAFEGIRWAWTPKLGIHHPKVYIFHQGNHVTALIGSANLTRQAFLYNVEATAVLQGSHEEMADVLRFFAERWEPADEVTPGNLAAYSLRWSTMNQEHRETEAQLAEEEESAMADAIKRAERAGGRLLSWDWDEYVGRLYEVDALWRPFGSSIDIYLQMFEEIPPLLAHPLTKLSRVERQALFGLESEDYPHAPWLGRMGGAGHAKHLLVEDDEKSRAIQQALWKALQQVPRGDALPPPHRVRDAFAQIVALDHLGPAIATRYLTLLRPDACVSLNSASKEGFARLFRMPGARMSTAEGYAECLQKVWLAPWMNSPRPVDGLHAKLWENRAALLDAFVYRPRSGKHPDKDWE